MNEKGKISLEDREDRDWVKAPIRSGRWVPEGAGDELIGTYIDDEKGSFRGRPNCKYYFETDHPAANSDGIAYVYGTEAINEGMKDIPVGYRVKITYRGEKPTPDPKKKAFKVFDVCAFICRDDPLYRKWYPDEENSVPGPGLQSQDYTVTDELIDSYREILESKDPYKKVTCEAIIKEAEADEELEPAELTNLKLRLIQLYKAGKVESEKKRGGE